jgi:hypothetical protein
LEPDSRFTIAFLRDGEVLDARAAATGREAVKVALLLIVQQDELQHGDKLTERTFSMMHFVKHPHLRPVEIQRPPPKVTIIERLRHNGLFVFYGAVYAGLVAIALYGLLGR